MEIGKVSLGIARPWHMAVPVLDLRAETRTLAVGFGDLEGGKELILLTVSPPRSSQDTDNVWISCFLLET